MTEKLNHITNDMQEAGTVNYNFYDKNQRRGHGYISWEDKEIKIG